jgi:hypothetical protein
LSCKKKHFFLHFLNWQPKITKAAYIFSYGDFDFGPDEIAFLNRWLHTPRDDGKSRVLILPLDYSERAIKISHFIYDTIKEVICFAIVFSHFHALL